MLSILFDGRKRSFWFLIGSIALLMNVFALYLQHALDLEPCAKCVDQRISLYLITLTSLLASASNVRSAYFHAFRILTLASLVYATYLSLNHYLMTIDPNPFAISCSLEPNLPVWLPIHQWIPDIFGADGVCGETHIKILNMGLVQWTMIGCISLSTYAALGSLRFYRLFFKKTFSSSENNQNIDS